MADLNKTAKEKYISLEILVFINLIIVLGAVILKALNPLVVNFYTEAIRKADILNYLLFTPIIMVVLTILVYRSLKPIRAFAQADTLRPEQLQEIRTAAFNLPFKITAQFLIVILSIVAFAALVWDAFVFNFFPLLDRLLSMGLIWAYTICSSLATFIYLKFKMTHLLRATSGVAKDKGFRLPIKARFTITTLALSATVFLFIFVFSFSSMNDAFWHDEIEKGKALLSSFKERAKELQDYNELKEYLKSRQSKEIIFVMNSAGEYLGHKPAIIPDDDITRRILIDPEGTAKVSGISAPALRILPLEGQFKGLYAGTIITLAPGKQDKMRFIALFFLVMGCVLLPFVVIISYCVAYDTSTVVRDVTRQMVKISDRKETLYSEVKVTSLDEVGDLIRAFNNLQRVVNSYQQDLDKANRRVLEMEKRRADEAVHDYRLLAENITDVIFTLDLNMQLIYVSPSIQCLRGYSVEESMKQGIRKWFTSGSLIAGLKTFQEEIKMMDKGLDRFTSRTLELEVTRKDGPPVWAEAKTNPLLNCQGDPVGTLCVLRDITERKKMEEEMLQVEKLNAVGVLAGGIAHDFNNLLTAIIGNLSSAELYVTPMDNIFELLAKAKKASWQASQLTKQLLTFSKGGAPIKESASICQVIEDTASFALTGSNTKCEKSLPEDLWPVKIDKTQVSQVINNLIINANQAMPEGGIIKINAGNITVEKNNSLPLKEGKYIQISVKDQGIGIAPEQLDKIFDPYFTTKKTGSGLGLATSYSIIKNHGGYIHVESTLGVGTTFNIYLPVSDKGVFAVKRIEERKRLFYGRGKILFMDDQQSIREMIGRILTELGYEVVFAKEGHEAVRLYKTAKDSGKAFDAVILDLTIPGGMGGKEVIQRLHEIDPQVKAIVSSGYANDPIMSEYKRFGFKNVVAKPYEMQLLSKTLWKVINESDRSLRT